MMLDLHARPEGEPRFLADWRRLYEAPYDDDARLPPGPILVVGAGTGNDVMAALRRTKRDIYAVDIDPAIVELGRRHHPESPYASPRVTVVIDDARSFFQRTHVRFAMVVFGYLDSHTLLSSFSSLRLDNFVYTRESLEQVRRILLPGGSAVLTFCTATPWMHDRFLQLLSETFGRPADFLVSPGDSYSYGVVYRNLKGPGGPGGTAEAASPAAGRPDPSASLPTDDWPFLYLRTPQIPDHYRIFLVLVVASAFLALLVLPRGQRSIRLPYFFLGCSFFLLETSNIVSLSLLFGSTWIVNAFVFAGILALVLLGNVASTCVDRKRLPLVFAGIGATLLVAYCMPVSRLLQIESRTLREFLAVFVFLGPVFFASVAFGTLIRDEAKFYQAYGSNILGAVVGGALEYLSLMLGFKFLLVLTGLFYLLAYVTWRIGDDAGPALRVRAPEA
jgi:SAM-dependent methyltransferase